jgi:S1-C subfamily serine protease
MTSHTGRRLLVALGLLLALTLVAGCCPLSVPAVQRATPTRLSARPTATTPAASAQPAVLGSFSTAIRDVARQVRPAVVQIANEQLMPGSVSQAVPQTTGIGSGVIFDAQGHILTNNHVVAGAEQLTVALPDGRRFTGKLIGSDVDTDLAVIQISADSLPLAPLGQSGALEVGDWVVAIGNALGLPGGPTVTAGVVSALGRAVQEPGTGNEPGPYLYDLIQTDAAINPGNSGGPLINLQGEVVGINTLVAGIAEEGLQTQGIGFAIAIDTVRPIAGELVATGRVVHPYMGIRYQALNPALAVRLGLNVDKGVLLSQVIADSPAAQAGLQVGDVIVAIDDQQLVDESTLGRVLKGHRPGDTITLQIVRGNRTLGLTLKLGEKQGS